MTWLPEPRHYLWSLAVLALVGSLMTTTPERADASEEASTVKLAVANLREGSLVRHRADQRDGTDLKAFARRVVARPGRLPDVLAVQEVLGSAGRVAQHLNDRPRTRRDGSRYVVAVPTRRSVVTGACQGSRKGRFTLLRGATLLVNTATVTRVHAQGFIRTWGRWGPKGREEVGRNGFGCTEHPWARVSVRQPGRAALTAHVVTAHLPPRGTDLKNSAVREIHGRIDAMQGRMPSDVTAIGGDLNLTRCRQPLGAPERRDCAVRAGHRSLTSAGYRDAVRSLHLTGPDGVVGVNRRIDFIHAKAEVASSWLDRCYQAFRVTRRTCGAKRSIFSSQRQFFRCQTRSLAFGRPGCHLSAGVVRKVLLRPSRPHGHSPMSRSQAGSATKTGISRSVFFW